MVWVLVQDKKLRYPIEVTVLGMAKLLSFVEQAKENSPIVLSPLLRVTEVRFLAPAKA